MCQDQESSGIFWESQIFFNLLFCSEDFCSSFSDMFCSGIHFGNCILTEIKQTIFYSRGRRALLTCLNGGVLLLRCARARGQELKVRFRLTGYQSSSLPSFLWKGPRQPINFMFFKTANESSFSFIFLFLFLTFRTFSNFIFKLNIFIVHFLDSFHFFFQFQTKRTVWPVLFARVLKIFVQN